MIRFFAGHPTAANLLMALFMLAGLFALPRVLRETMPDFASKEVEIRLLYPGATAAEVEETIAQRLEDALGDVNFVQEIRSDSREGLSVTTVEMSAHGDFPTFFDDIERGLATIDDFPEGVEKPVVMELGRTDLVLSILVSGPMSAAALKAHAEELKDRLQEDGLNLIDVLGFSEHQLRVSLSAPALRQTGLTVPQVAAAITAQNRDLPLGLVETRDQDILIRFAEQRRTPADLAGLTVWAGPDGGIIRLGDIAVIDDRFEREEEKIVHQGRRCALLNIRKTKAEDSIRVADRAKAFLAAERQRQPQVSLLVVQDESLILRDRLSMLWSNGVQGFVLVFLVMWLFFSFRFSFWVAMGLPVSFLGAMFCAPRLGLSVNMFTMVGMLLALGLLMDDAIVIAENIAAHRQRGKKPLAAVADGVREVAGGVVSSFVTTVCVLGPLAFITGQIGRVLRVVPMILLLVLAVSLVEAFLILPAHLRHTLEKDQAVARPRLRRQTDAFLAWLQHAVAETAVAALIRRRYLVVSIVTALLILSVGLLASGKLKIQGFPELEGETVVARLLMPQGTPLARTEQTVQHLLDALERTNAVFSPRQPGGRPLVEHAYVQYGHNPDAFESGPHVASLTVSLLRAEKRVGAIDEYLAEWRRQIGALPDVISLTLSEPGFGPAGRPLEIRLRGHSLPELKDAVTDLKGWFGQFQGVVNLDDDLRPGKPELRFRLRDEARGIGLTVTDVARQLQSAYQGVVADELQVGSESYAIDVRLQAADRGSRQTLDDFLLLLPDGREVPLRAVVNWEETRSWARIARFNRQRSATLFGDVDTRLANTSELIRRFRATRLPELRRQYPGVSCTIDGEPKEAGQARMSMLAALGIGMIGIFLLLSLQFRTYTEPLIVLIAIPFAMIGIFWGHFLMGVNICMPSLLGFVALSGVVVNNSILLVIFLKNARQEKLSLSESCVKAGTDRFRAIMLSSGTTIAGLLPIMFERSLQAQILQPLVISTVFGLAA
ncbi:MAG: efflux RND transporter permease subunit, partial [Lentisphaeria bacterium]|nr:efflux RND transporter permease subunit [Lentisphaeria bacterium]